MQTGAQDGVCDGISSLTRAATSTAMIDAAKDTLSHIAPKIYMSILDSLGSSTDDLKDAYTELAKSFGLEFNKIRFNLVKSALTEISLA